MIERSNIMAGSSMDTEAAGKELKQGSGGGGGYTMPATAHAVDTGMYEPNETCMLG